MTSMTSWKVLVWSAGALSLAAIAAGGSACTVTATVTGVGDDGGAIEQPGADAAPGEEASTGQDASEEASATDDASATDEDSGGSCATGIDTGIPACDTCVESSCCTQLDACGTPDSSGVDDAGASFCIDYLQCVLDFANMAGGTVAEGQTSCSPAYNSTQTANGNALLSCITGSCSTQCQ